MDPNSGRDRGNLNYMSFGITMSDSGDLYSNPNAVALTRPPSGGLGGQVMNRNSLMNTNSQCGGNLATNNNRGIKRTSSDCYDDRGGGMNQQGMNTMDNCGPGNVQDVVDDSYTQIQKKSPPANGKKTKGRVKIKMEYIDNKLRRYTTFSKRKTGIMKKAYELSTLTGTQVMLLVASETGHVYTFATRKLQPMITSEAGKQLIQTCLNSPDPPTGATTGDQRMSATGFEETELSYNIADEESNKDDRSPLSSGDSEDESDDDSQVIPIQTSNKNGRTEPPELQQIAKNMDTETWMNRFNGAIVPQATISKMPSNIFGQLLQSGHLQIHQDQDGTRQYIRFPLVMSPPKISTLTASSSTASTSSAVSDSIGNATITDLSTTNKNGRESTNSTYNDIIIKEEFNE